MTQVTGYKRKEIKFGIWQCSLATKEKKSNWDGHQHGITAIPTSVAASIKEGIRHSLKFQP